MSLSPTKSINFKHDETSCILATTSHRHSLCYDEDRVCHYVEGVGHEGDGVGHGGDKLGPDWDVVGYA